MSVSSLLLIFADDYGSLFKNNKLTLENFNLKISKVTHAMHRPLLEHTQEKGNLDYLGVRKIVYFFCSIFSVGFVCFIVGIS